MTTFDAAILGLGALGSAALLQFSQRGARVLGIDRFAPPHDLGSTHGETRITRMAIGEGAHLTPLASRSNVLWREIAQETGRPLLSNSGLLIISSREKTSFTHVADFFPNTVKAARAFGVAHEIWDAPSVRRRFPQFRIGDHEVGYYEPEAGFLRPEACVAAQLEIARLRGAEIRTGERVMGFTPRPHDVVITTDRNSYIARTLVIAAGPWLPELLDDRLAGLFRVVPQAQFWFAPGDDSFRSDRFPTFIWELSGRKQAIYGFPDIDGTGVKVATEQYEVAAEASSASREVNPSACTLMYETYVRPFLPGLSATCTRATACLYTVTADFGFVVDRHPDSENIIIASCCSGHGFKHAAALGEALSQLVLDGRSLIDLSPFGLARLSSL
jgi:sarcosine oxidase